MLKRHVVSLFRFLKVKGRRNYWEPPKNQEIIKDSLIKQNKEIPKEILELLENQEKKQIKIIDELTNQKKVIEKISYKLYEIQNYSYDSRIIQILMLLNTYLLIFKK